MVSFNGTPCTQSIWLSEVLEAQTYGEQSAV